MQSPPSPDYLEADSRGELGHCTKLRHARPPARVGVLPAHPRGSCCSATRRGPGRGEAQLSQAPQFVSLRSRPGADLGGLGRGCFACAASAAGRTPCAHPPGGKTEARAARGRPLLDGGRGAVRYGPRARPGRRGASSLPGPAAARRLSRAPAPPPPPPLPPLWG